MNAELNGSLSTPLHNQERHQYQIEKDVRPELSFRSGTQWMQAYQRNNKSKGQKNLRCFPNCCAGYGHQDGFCGQSIGITFRSSVKNVKPQSLHALGEFSVSTAEQEQVGDFLVLNDVQKNIRSSLDGNRSFMEGFTIPADRSDLVESPGEVIKEFEFNKNLKGWHYGFLGSKKTRDFYHQFRAFVVEKQTDNPNKFKIIAIINSPPWQMYCRRRKHTLHSIRQKNQENDPSNTCKTPQAEKNSVNPTIITKTISDKTVLRRKESRQRSLGSNRSLVGTKRTHINEVAFSPRKRTNRNPPRLDTTLQEDAPSMVKGGAACPLSPFAASFQALLSARSATSPVGAYNFHQAYTDPSSQKTFHNGRWSPFSPVRHGHLQQNSFSATNNGYCLPKVIDDIDKFLIDTAPQNDMIPAMSKPKTSPTNTFFKQEQNKINSAPMNEFFFDQFI